MYSSGTLYSRWADDEGLLEGFSLSAQLRVSGLEWNTLLRQTRDVDGSLLVQTRLVVEQRNVAAQRQRLAARGRHLLKDKAEVVMGVALKKASDLIATEYKKNNLQHCAHIEQNKNSPTFLTELVLKGKN